MYNARKHALTCELKLHAVNARCPGPRIVIQHKTYDDGGNTDQQRHERQAPHHLFTSLQLTFVPSLCISVCLVFHLDDVVQCFLVIGYFVLVRAYSVL